LSVAVALNSTLIDTSSESFRMLRARLRYGFSWSDDAGDPAADAFFA